MKQLKPAGESYAPIYSDVSTPIALGVGPQIVGWEVTRRNGELLYADFGGRDAKFYDDPELVEALLAQEEVGGRHNGMGRVGTLAKAALLILGVGIASQYVTTDDSSLNTYVGDTHQTANVDGDSGLEFEPGVNYIMEYRPRGLGRDDSAIRRGKRKLSSMVDSLLRKL